MHAYGHMDGCRNSDNYLFIDSMHLQSFHMQPDSHRLENASALPGDRKV